MNAPNLFSLLGRNWEMPMAIVDATFSADDSTVAFTGVDGSLALAAMDDPEPPEQRLRLSADSGRATIRERSRAVKPLVRIEPFAQPPIMLSAYRDGRFIAGTRDGRIHTISSHGDHSQVTPDKTERITALVHHPGTSRTAWAGPDTLSLARDGAIGGAERARLAQPCASLAFSGSGDLLAVVHPDSVSIWQVDEAIEICAHIACPDGPIRASWHASEGLIACSLRKGGFRIVPVAAADDGGPARGRTISGFPTLVQSIDWSDTADAVIASGAYRVAAWSADALERADQHDDAVATGKPGLTIVDRIAAHPAKGLVAAGYANGLVNVAQIGAPDELMILENGHGAINALAWSRDGGHLAIGATDGFAAIVSFPPHMFK